MVGQGLSLHACNLRATPGTKALKLDCKGKSGINGNVTTYDIGCVLAKLEVPPGLVKEMEATSYHDGLMVAT